MEVQAEEERRDIALIEEVVQPTGSNVAVNLILFALGVVAFVFGGFKYSEYFVTEEKPPEPETEAPTEPPTEAPEEPEDEEDYEETVETWSLFDDWGFFLGLLVVLPVIYFTLSLQALVLKQVSTVGVFVFRNIPVLLFLITLAISLFMYFQWRAYPTRRNVQLRVYTQAVYTIILALVLTFIPATSAQDVMLIAFVYGIFGLIIANTDLVQMGGERYLIKIVPTLLLLVILLLLRKGILRLGPRVLAAAAGPIVAALGVSFIGIGTAVTSQKVDDGCAEKSFAVVSETEDFKKMMNGKTSAEVRRGYRRVSRTVHPDTCEASCKSECERTFNAVTKAKDERLRQI